MTSATAIAADNTLRAEPHERGELPKPTVLLLHNRYREPGGEERSVAEIAALLRARGHGSRCSSARAQRSRRARARRAAARDAARRAAARPRSARRSSARGAEVVHAHNLNPLFGPRALAAARAAGARVVMHLHNYRLVCAIAIAYRDGGDLHALPRAQHAAGRPPALPRQPPRGGGLRAPGSSRTSRSGAGGGRPVRRAEPGRGGRLEALRRAGRPHGRAAQLPAGRRVRAAQHGRRGRVRAVRRPAGRGEGRRHGDRGGRARRRAAAGRGRRAPRPAPASARRAERPVRVPRPAAPPSWPRRGGGPPSPSCPRAGTSPARTR